MKSNKKYMNYVSEIDRFLQSVDRKHPQLSASQQKEWLKYQRIYKLRDAIEQSDQSPLLLRKDF